MAEDIQPFLASRKGHLIRAQRYCKIIISATVMRGCHKAAAKIKNNTF
jgi:hypothetical protein